MRTKFFLAIMILLTSHSIYGQDLQWVVKNGHGICRPLNSSYCQISPPATDPQYPYNLTHNYVDFEEFHHPLASQQSARNDLFIMFNNGHCFNSYLLNDYAWSQVADGGLGYSLSSNSIMNFQIQNLYWTNRYEGEDEPPLAVKSLNTQGFVSIVNDPNLVLPGLSDHLNFPALSVNHDIVPNKDLTVIIKGDTCYDYKLIFNTCVDADDNCNNLLEASSSDIPGTNLTSPMGNVISNISLNSVNMAYFNFNINNNISHLIESDAIAEFILEYKSKTGKPSHCPNIINDWIELEREEVPVLLAHDPNFISLNSLCNINGDLFANYLIQVQNDGLGITQNVSLDVSFPDCIDVDNIYLQSFNIGTINSVNISLDEITCTKLNSNTIKFEFQNPWDLFPISQSKDELNSIANIELCAKIDCPNGIDPRTCDTCLTLSPASSWFNNDNYNISTFVDLVQLKEGDTWYRPINNECKCNLEVRCPCSCPWYSFYCCGNFKWPTISIAVIVAAIIAYFIGT